MKLIRAATMAAAMLACTSPVLLGACSTTQTITASLTLDKAMLVAEQSFSATVGSMEIAVNNGTLRGASATKALAILDQAHTALLLARQAQRTGRALIAQSQASTVKNLTDQAEAVIAGATLAPQP